MIQALLSRSCGGIARGEKGAAELTGDPRGVLRRVHPAVGGARRHLPPGRTGPGSAAGQLKPVWAAQTSASAQAIPGDGASDTAKEASS